MTLDAGGAGPRSNRIWARRIVRPQRGILIYTSCRGGKSQMVSHRSQEEVKLANMGGLNAKVDAVVANTWPFLRPALKLQT